MSIKWKFLSAILAVILCLSFVSCASKNNSANMFYFNSDIHVETRNKSLSSETLDKIDKYLCALENEFSISKENSIINKFNDLKAGESIELSEQAIKVFKEVIFAQEFSDGKFNVSVYPLSKLWGFADGYPLVNFIPPTDSQIDQILTSGAVDVNAVYYDTLLTEEMKLKKLHDDTKIDLGGILKGYATDEIGKLLSQSGYKSGYVSIGTSSLYLLSVESLKIRHPRNSENLPSIISVNLKGEKNLNVSTSGDYEKTHVFNGKTYSHLINPFTGKPAETGVMSATVIGADGGFSDAVTTALCICNHSFGDSNSELILLCRKILQEYPLAKIFVLWSDGSNNLLLTNEKQGEDFTLLDDAFSVETF